MRLVVRLLLKYNHCNFLLFLGEKTLKKFILAGLLASGVVYAEFQKPLP